MSSQSIRLLRVSVIVCCVGFRLPHGHDGLPPRRRHHPREPPSGAHANHSHAGGERAWRLAGYRLRAAAKARRAFRLRRALMEAVAVGCRVEVLKIVINHSNAGLFAYITFALNQLLYAEQQGLFPVVFFGATSGCEAGGDASTCGPNAYYDEASGPNVWEYYFLQPGNVSLEEIYGMQRAGADIAIRTLDAQQLWQLHLQERLGVFTHAYGYYEDVDAKTMHYDAAWWRGKKLLAHRLIRDYVALREDVLEEATLAVAEMLDPVVDLREEEGAAFNIGIHIRGTDKGVWGGARKVNRVVAPEEFARAIDVLLAADDEPDAGSDERGEAQGGSDGGWRGAGNRRGENAGLSRVKLYVATDQRAFRDFFLERYGGGGQGGRGGRGWMQVLWRAELVSDSGTSVFSMDTQSIESTSNTPSINTNATSPPGGGDPGIAEGGERSRVRRRGRGVRGGIGGTRSKNSEYSDFQG